MALGAEEQVIIKNLSGAKNGQCSAKSLLGAKAKRCFHQRPVRICAKEVAVCVGMQRLNATWEPEEVGH